MSQVAPSLFWDDLAEDLKDPDFLRAFVVETVRIATIDRIINEVDELRTDLGLSKAALARAIAAKPDVVRRLLTAGHVNPTLGTLAEVAAVLGMRVTLTPMDESEQTCISTSLRTGECQDTATLAERLTEMREHHDDLVPA